MPPGPDPTLVLAAWLVGAVSVVTGLSVLSRVVRIQRERHVAAWEADGRPAAPWTLPWRIPPAGDPSVPRNPFDLLRTNLLLMRWLLRTPPWARDDAQARRLLWMLRALQLVALAAGAVFLVQVLPSIRRR